MATPLIRPRKRSIPSATGRPTKYKPEYDELATKYCLLGAINADLAKFFEVSLFTIEEWLRKIPSFSRAIKKGRVEADANVASKLYARAVGYSYTEEHQCRVGDKIIRTPINKHCPPDVAAEFIWLKNRRPANWRDRVEHTVADPDDAARKIRELLQGMEETTSGGKS
jgi:hypothetical protein